MPNKQQPSERRVTVPHTLHREGHPPLKAGRTGLVKKTTGEYLIVTFDGDTSPTTVHASFLDDLFEEGGVS